MAFKNKDLSVLAYANGFTLWHYTSADTKTDVTVSGYFDDVADTLRKGDMVIVNAGTDGTAENSIMVVSSVSEGAVSIADVAASA